MTTLPIFAGAAPVGAIEASPDGPLIRYDADWRASQAAFPISLRMPLSGETWGPDVATPWLMNLLPEGEPLRAMTRALGVAGDDLLGLIVETGGDLAGALSIGRPRPAGRPRTVPIGGEATLERIIEELPAKPFLVGEDGVSMSLAGAQDKLPLAMTDGALAIPVDGAASTHILKPDNPRLPGSVQNEALCMTLARACGLRVAGVTTGLAAKRSYLLVERYDRVIDGDQVRRIHQEDFCQALGRPPAAKYEHNGTGTRGPSLAEMFALVREHMTARDITALLDAVIFNVAIGNVDSHAKNYSVLLLGPARSALAPLYDLMSGLAWPNITQNHAQDVADQRRGRHIYGRHWRRFAEAAGLAAPATVRRVAQLTDRILSQLPAAAAAVEGMPAGGHAMLAQFVDAIGRRARTVRANAALDQDAPTEDKRTSPEIEDRRYDA